MFEHIPNSSSRDSLTRAYFHCSVAVLDLFRCSRFCNAGLYSASASPDRSHEFVFEFSVPVDDDRPRVTGNDAGGTWSNLAWRKH